MLETAGIKLAGVASDVFGVSGRAILRALINAQDTPVAMADLARGKLRRKHQQLARALGTPLAAHQRLMLRTQLARVEQTEADLEQIDASLREMSAPFQPYLRLLMSIPGIDRLNAVSIIAEIGVDMTVFHSADHLASWCGICPGNNESAGKQRSGKIRKGNVVLKTVLVNAAVTGSRRANGTYLAEKYRRLVARRGPDRLGVYFHDRSV